ncbi:MAG: EAL domain-containing protein [Chloroflexi bacterium]|nr:EAL domain-containing protein [Chloroflexota bacterium]
MSEHVEISTRLPAPPARRLRVLLTGATGYIAAQLLPVFRQRYELRLIDVRASEAAGQPVDGVQVTNLLDAPDDALRVQFENIDVVVHLGYYHPAHLAVTGAGKSYLDERPNVDMAERVFRHALDANVRRVVVASSNHAADWYEPLLHARQLDVIGPDDPPKSDNYYGWAKIAYEALGFMYACGAFGRKLEMVQVRIGAPRQIDVGELGANPAAYKRDLGAYISPRDLQQLFVRSIEAEHIEDRWSVPFQIFYGISDNARAFWSIANARQLIGYDPQDLPNTDAQGVIAVEENLLRRLQASFSVENQSVLIGARIGVALSPEHGAQADTLLRRADVALNVAKRTGVGLALYRPEQDPNSTDRLTLIGELRRAIDGGELVLQYQPKVDLRTGRLCSVEALVRWAHPSRGLLTPDEFIPVAEQAGLIEPLSRWVMRAALHQVNAWGGIGLEIPVAVNLSMRSFRDEQLPEKVAELLSQTQTPPHLLMLEITESTLMADPNRTLAILGRLRATGIRIAIDDFGTGHSSLAYLKRLPVDELKIDRSFIADIATDAKDRAIVRCTVDLAHSLGLRVVAEGIEDAVTEVVVAELGCDEAQGFYLSPALNGGALATWQADKRRRYSCQNDSE